MTRERTPEQRGRMSRVKGATYERDVSASLREVYPNAKRGLIQTRVGEECPDVINTPWWIETKHHIHVQIRKAFEQAEAASAASPNSDYKNLPPCVISKDTGKSELVTISLEQFLRLATLAEQHGVLMKRIETMEANIDAFIDGDES